MCTHRFFCAVGVMRFQRTHNPRVLPDKQFKWGDLRQAQITHTIHLGLDVLDSVPRSNAVNGLRDQEMKPLVECEKRRGVVDLGGRFLIA
jgi:hypothetical protein